MSLGSFQVTSRLHPVSFVAVTLGADGLDGTARSTSVTSDGHFYERRCRRLYHQPFTLTV